MPLSIVFSARLPVTPTADLGNLNSHAQQDTCISHLRWKNKNGATVAALGNKGPPPALSRCVSMLTTSLRNYITMLVLCNPAVTDVSHTTVKHDKLLRLEKIQMKLERPFWIFFQPLLNFSKNYLLVTCITNLKRIGEKLFKLSRPQGQIIDVKCEKSH